MDIFRYTEIYDNYSAIEIGNIRDEHIPIMLRTDDKEIIPKWLSHQLNNVYPRTILESGTLTTINVDSLVGPKTEYIYIGVLKRVKNKEEELK